MSAIVSPKARRGMFNSWDVPGIAFYSDNFYAFTKVLHENAIEFIQANDEDFQSVACLAVEAKREFTQRKNFEHVVSYAHHSLTNMYDMADIKQGDDEILVSVRHTPGFPSQKFPAECKTTVVNGLFVDLMVDKAKIDFTKAAHLDRLTTLLIDAMAPYYEQKHAANGHRCANAQPMRTQHHSVQQQQQLFPLLPPPEKRSGTRQPVSRVLSQQ